MAAAPAQRNIVYFTFSDEEFGDRLSFMHSILREKNVTVGMPYSSSSPPPSLLISQINYTLSSYSPLYSFSLSNIFSAQLFKAFTEFNAIMSEAKSSLEIFDYLEVRFNS